MLCPYQLPVVGNHDVSGGGRAAGIFAPGDGPRLPMISVCLLSFSKHKFVTCLEYTTNGPENGNFARRRFRFLFDRLSING
jgi:hypothetical protein